MNPLRAIAIHLPQFHPIPENDSWWGKGFTEWTNVTKAKPLFEGHYQPHLPADLGFYDLRLEEARIAQAELAKAYGIHGFCYYHYWFNGKRLLERPVDEILKSGKPDFPFMLCWANESWTRRWDGGEDMVLMHQDYPVEDAARHLQALLPFFRDERYIRIDNKPVFAIYRPKIIPNLSAYFEAFRQAARKENIELYLCAFETFSRLDADELNANFDAAVEFQPQSSYLADYMKATLAAKRSRPLARLYAKTLWLQKKYEALDRYLHTLNHYLDYNEYVDYVLEKHRYPADYKRFPGLTPMWDNAARHKEKAFLLANENPAKYGEWLSHHVKNFKPYSKEENLLFINAWNEWAEGNHLEPCQKWGRQYLEATQKALQSNAARQIGANQSAPREAVLPH